MLSFRTRAAAIAGATIGAAVLAAAIGLPATAATTGAGAPARSAPVISAKHVVRAPAASVLNSCAAHDWCAYSNYDFNINTGGTEWTWSNYSYNHWYYVGSAENDKWHSWVSGRGWTTIVGYSYPESQKGIAACFGGGAVVAYPGNYPGTSISEAGSISSIDFATPGAECP